MDTKKTSLYQLHQDSNAKFVEFAGYQMPIQYSEGIVEEHRFTRNHSGIFDVSHMGQLFIYGEEDLVDDLERIFPLDLKNLKLNHSKYSFLMIRRPPRSTHCISSAASDVYKRQVNMLRSILPERFLGSCSFGATKTCSLSRN